MERETFDELISILDEVQDDALESAQEHYGPDGKPTKQHMYFLGKDVGIGRAKTELRNLVEVDDE